MNYMLNFNVCEISSLLLENVALRMGNLQVIKISCWFCCCEWLPLTLLLWWGTLLMFSILYIFIY